MRNEPRPGTRFELFGGRYGWHWLDLRRVTMAPDPFAGFRSCPARQGEGLPSSFGRARFDPSGAFAHPLRGDELRQADAIVAVDYPG